MMFCVRAVLLGGLLCMQLCWGESSDQSRLMRAMEQVQQGDQAGYGAFVQDATMRQIRHYAHEGDLPALKKAMTQWKGMIQARKDRRAAQIHSAWSKELRDISKRIKQIERGDQQIYLAILACELGDLSAASRLPGAPSGLGSNWEELDERSLRELAEWFAAIGQSARRNSLELGAAFWEQVCYQEILRRDDLTLTPSERKRHEKLRKLFTQRGDVPLLSHRVHGLDLLQDKNSAIRLLDDDALGFQIEQGRAMVEGDFPASYAFRFRFMKTGDDHPVGFYLPAGPGRKMFIDYHRKGPGVRVEKGRVVRTSDTELLKQLSYNLGQSYLLEVSVRSHEDHCQVKVSVDGVPVLEVKHDFTEVKDERLAEYLSIRGSQGQLLVQEAVLTPLHQGICHLLSLDESKHKRVHYYGPKRDQQQHDLHTAQWKNVDEGFNPGHVGISGESLVFTAKAGKHGKAAFELMDPAMSIDAPILSLKIKNPNDRPAKVAIVIQTGKEFTWFETDVQEIAAHETAQIVADMRSATWKSERSQWKPSDTPDQAAAIKSLKLVLLNDRQEQQLELLDGLFIRR